MCGLGSGTPHRASVAVPCPEEPLPPAPRGPPRRQAAVRARRSTIRGLCGLRCQCGVSVMLVRSGVDNPFRDARTTLEPRLSTSKFNNRLRRVRAIAPGYRSLYVTRTRSPTARQHTIPQHRRRTAIPGWSPSLSALGAPPQAQHGPWMPVATMVAASLLSLKSRPQPVSHEHMHIHTYGVSTQRAPHHSHPSHSLKRDVQQHDFGDRAPTPEGSFHTQPHHASSRYNTTEFRQARGSCRPPFTLTRSHWLTRSSQRRWRAREVANKARDAVSGAHRRDASILDQPAHRYAL